MAPSRFTDPVDPDAPPPSALFTDTFSDPDPIYDPKDNPRKDATVKQSGGLGKVGDELHDAVVRAIVDQESYLRESLTTPFQRFTRYWQLFLGQKRDRRKEFEKWRANVTVPYANSAIRTMTAAVSDILNSSDPPIQPDAVGEEDEENVVAIQRLLEYMLRKNKWELRLDMGLTDAGVQGIWWPKLIHKKTAQKVLIIPTSKDKEEFLKSIKDAEMALGQRAPLNSVEEFEVWRDLVNRGSNVRIPEMPLDRYEEVVFYSGPTIVHDPIWGYRFDPFIDDCQNQDLIIHRVVVTEAWLASQTGEGPGKPYDPDQVKAGKENGSTERFSEWQQQVNTMMGLDQPSSDPRYQQAQEIWECWRKDSQHPFLTILNRRAIINKPDKGGSFSNPYNHGRYPFFPVRNSPIVGHALGVSELQPVEPLLHEMNSLRDLRLDAVTLAVLPVFLRLNEAGMPDLAKLLRPGMVIPSSRPEGIQQLLKYNEGIMTAFRELDAIKADIDETTATPPSLRGGPSTVGRVSATESERRFSQALVRQKERVLLVENDLSEMVHQALFLFYQFHPSGERIRVGGSDPFVTYSTSMFQEALSMDFRFRGASKALNRDMVEQQLNNFAKQYSTYLTPVEMRKLMKRAYEVMGVKGVKEVISDAGTQEIIARYSQPAPAPGGQPGQGGAPPPQGGGGQPPQPGQPPEGGGPPPGEDVLEGADAVAALSAAGGDGGAGGQQ